MSSYNHTTDPHQQSVLEAIEAGQSILLCGRAGTGKSYTLNQWTQLTKKNHVLLAPTGVAALHLGGQTIHSFFQIAPGSLPHEVADKAGSLPKNKQNMIKAIETLVIDEISMVRADLLDCVDITIRIVTHNPQPFGGKQLVLVGDMYQLPPVVKSHEKQLFTLKGGLKLEYAGFYFFHSQAFASGFTPRLHILQHAFRQQDDPEFLTLLNTIRNCSVDSQQLAQINHQVSTAPQPTGTTAIYLTGTNQRANTINQRHLQSLSGEQKLFTASQWGQVDARTMPVDTELQLKIGARVMITRNDHHLDRWVNGTTGTVTSFYTDTAKDGTTTTSVQVQKDTDGAKVKIVPCSWEVYRYVLKNDRLERDLVGAFTQIPLRLAWAVTIHKAQGKTFDSIIVDLEDAIFAHGQAYVALSRCTNLQGISLTSPLEKRHILLDTEITKFMASYQVQQARTEQSQEELEATINTAIAACHPLRIDYLHNSDSPSSTIIEPQKLSDIEYKGSTHRCLTARKENGQNHYFNLARMLGAYSVAKVTQEKASSENPA